MPRTPLTAMGICGERGLLDRAASGSFLGAEGQAPRHPPGICGTLALHPQLPAPFTTSHPSPLDRAHADRLPWL